MPAPTPTPQEMLALYTAAEAEIVSGAQESRIGDRMYTRAQLAEVQAGRRYWQSVCKAAAVGSSGLTFSSARFD